MNAEEADAPDTERVYAELFPHEQRVVRDICAFRDLTTHDWPNHRCLLPFVDFAVRRVQVRVKDAQRDAVSWTAALWMACGRLGLSADAVERRWGGPHPYGPLKGRL